jgi:hypothetical protein
VRGESQDGRLIARRNSRAGDNRPGDGDGYSDTVRLDLSIASESDLTQD